MIMKKKMNTIVPTTQKQPTNLERRNYRNRNQYSQLVSCWMITCLLFNIVTCDEFNTQIIPRVTERLTEFMNIPVHQSQRLIQYRTLHGFQYNMTAKDRTSIFTSLYTEIITAVNDKIPAMLYIGLEDGTFIYIEERLISVEYREPGESGYNAAIAANPANPNYKHLYSCVDDMTGELTQCILSPGESYIQCIDDCQLVPCQIGSGSVSKTKTSNIDTDELNDNDNENNKDVTIDEQKWCRNYQVLEVEENSDVSLGYIPSTVSCIDRKGQPEQRPGYVMTNYSNPTELGTCYYGDEKTVVNRTIASNYAACTSTTTSTGNTNTDVFASTNTNTIMIGSSASNDECNNVFIGGYESFNYDPRYRSWYADTKRIQARTWTEPYPFAGADNVMGITYSEPIYSTVVDPNDNYTSKTIFDGVAAVDYYLESISTFLVEYFADTNMKVIVIEQKAPYYIIASSLNDSVVSKTVLIDDTTQLCPDDKKSDETVCIPQRIDVNEIQQYGYNSSVLYRAFLEYAKLNFTNGMDGSSTISFKSSDDILSSQAYVTQGSLFSPFNNLNWLVFVVVPMNRSSSDAVLPGDPMFIVVCFIGLIGFFGCSGLLIKFYSKRKERAVIQSDWKFTCAFIGGCAAVNLSTITLLGENTNELCMIRMWSTNGLFVCALSPLFTKVWRMHKLLTTPNVRSRAQLNNFQLFLYTLPAIVIEILILTIFSFADPPRQTELLGVGDGIGEQQISCAHDTQSFLVTQCLYDGILVGIGCVLAFNTRDLDPRFGEAKQLGFSMYNVAFTGIVIMLIVNLVELDQVSIIILQAVGVLWASFFCSFAFVLPRLLDVSREHRRRSGRFSQSTNLATGLDNSMAYGDHSQASSNNLGESSHGKKTSKKSSTLEKSVDFKQFVKEEPLKQQKTVEPDNIRRKSEFGTSSSRVGKLGQSAYPFSTWESMVSNGGRGTSADDKTNSIAEMLRSLGKHSDDSTENNNTAPEQAPIKNCNSLTNRTVETIQEIPISDSNDSSSGSATAGRNSGGSTSGGGGGNNASSGSRGFHTELIGKDLEELAKGSSHRLDV